jgi:hypothetical protein
MDDPTRRNILAAGAAAASMIAMLRVFAHQTGQGGTGARFYGRGSVRIHYEEAGSGFPLMLLPSGGLNATKSFFTGNSPFNAIEEFKGQYHCITPDLGNAPAGRA